MSKLTSGGFAAIAPWIFRALTGGTANVQKLWVQLVNANQNIGNNTVDVIKFDTVQVDNVSGYSTSTGRFRPNIAGFWAFYSQLLWNNAASGSLSAAYIRKNGSTFEGQEERNRTIALLSNIVLAMVDFNGTTDFIEVCVQVPAASQVIVASAPATMLIGLYLGT